MDSYAEHDEDLKACLDAQKQVPMEFWLYDLVCWHKCKRISCVKNDVETMTMMKLNENKHLRTPKVYGGQVGDYPSKKIAALVMEDFSERATLVNMADGATVEQVL
jgi:hypothetical protein